VVFALDVSGSIGFDNFQRMTQFVGLLVQTLDIDSVTSGPTKDLIIVIPRQATAPQVCRS